jgi:hypothetical protein
MADKLLNGLPLSALQDGVGCCGGYYLNTLRALPPEGASLERLLFFLCAIEPLLQRFFCPQHFQGSYSAWVKYKLSSYNLAALKPPTPEQTAYFAGNIAAKPALADFFYCRTQVIEVEDLVLAGFYRRRLAALKSKAITPYKGQKGPGLMAGLEKGEFRFAPADAFSFWARARAVEARPGEQLRTNFLKGGYHWHFSDKDFREFAVDAGTYAGFGAPEKALVFDAVATRRYLFADEETARRLWAVFAGPLNNWSAAYLALANQKQDLLGVFRQTDPKQLKATLDAALRQLNAVTAGFFYAGNYGPTEDEDFRGLDTALDAIALLIEDKYRKAAALPDLWQDDYFKFLYLVAALWFKHCRRDLQTIPAAV